MNHLQNHLDKYGDWALVAGAAEGLGFAFSETLARCDKKLIMVDINPASLNQAAARLRSGFGTEIITVELDLSSETAAADLAKYIVDKDCRLVIYNAAYGPVKKFVSNTMKELDKYIDLNCRTLLHLAWFFASIPHTRKAGLLAMSSMAGLRGTQYVSPYAASKAFTWNLMESLSYEFRDSDIDFTAVCAGAIATENFKNTLPAKTTLSPNPSRPEDVALEALAMLGRTPIDVPGTGNRLSNFILTRLIPRRWAASITNSVMHRMYVDTVSGESDSPD